MADIHLTSGNDVYTQLIADKDIWNNIFGDDGNDTIKLYQGTAIGGPGNDVFERLVIPNEPWRELQVAYWNAGDNLKVNLEEGWAEDGQGGRDTLIGVLKIHGSGSKNAWVKGDSGDNYYWPNGGDDTYIGGAGNDGISINSNFTPSVGAPGRNALFSELNIQVSVDGRNAIITPKFGTGFTMTLTDVEYFDARTSSVDSVPWSRYYIADFVTQQTMAEQAIAAGSPLRWNFAQALGTATTVSYSFVTSAPASGVGATEFRAFTATEKQVVRELLAKTALLANITFTEVTEAASTVGQIRFGVSQQAATKGVSWLPNQSGAGDLAGDVWMDVESMLSLTPGTEGYQALLHEIGHALGLRHPRNVDAGDAWTLQMRPIDDRTALTVMSETPSSDGLFRADWGPLDVLALRYLYGSRTMNSGDTVYTLSAVQANAQTNIVDDGGIDTLDASAYAWGANINLVPGGLSNVGLSANAFAGVENLALPATTLIENAIGTAFDDVLTGNDADNRLTGGLGNDFIDGGKGVDTAVFAGTRAQYEISNSFGKVYVEARDGVSGFDTLLNIEKLAFADQTLTLATSPLGNDTVASVDEDAVLSASLPDPSDTTATPRASLVYSLVAAPAHGSVTVSTSGDYVYTPTHDYWGADSFTYRLATTGSAPTSNVYAVYLNVLPVNDGPPISANASTTIPPTSTYSSTLPVAQDVDGDPLSYSLLTDPTQGSVLLSSNGSFVYQPKPAYYGSDVFTYLVSDGQGGSNSYTFTLRTGLFTHEDTPLTQSLPDPVGALRANATYTLASTAAHGVVTVTPQGVFTFTPAANWFGDDSISYDVTVAAVTTRLSMPLRVLAVNDGPPVGSGASRAMDEDTALAMALPAAVDPDGDTAVYAIASNPAHGTASITSAGQLSYQPAANYNGPDTLTFKVSDSEGLFNTYTVNLTISPVNDAPTGGVAITGTARLGQTLTASNTLADVDGLGTFSHSWLRNGVPIANTNLPTYTLVPADIGTNISVRVSYIDGQGTSEAVTSVATAAVLGFNNIVGTAGNDSLSGGVNADSITGLAGNDTLLGAAGDDALVGGDGNDVLNGGTGNDTVEGGAGYDVADYRVGVAINANLLTGLVTQGTDTDTVLSIEAIFGSSGSDVIRGLDGPEASYGETVRGGAGNDTINGGTGNDTAEYSGLRAAYTVTRAGATSPNITVSHNSGGADGVDSLTSVERLIFSDKLLAFGARAEDVARVAFVLWSPAIPSIPAFQSLFARGLSFYDVGYDFNTLCNVAVGFFAQQGAEFAQLLITNTPGTSKSQADVLAIMNAAGGGNAGRAAAVSAMALDPITTAELDSTGVRLSGVVADLSVPGFGVLFAPTPG